MRRGYVIKKNDTTDNDTSSNSTDQTNSNEKSIPLTQNAVSGMYCKDVKYTGLNTGYKKSSSGSRQDNFSRDDILKRLENYIPLKTMKEKELLTQLPNFKSWVRYYNTETKQFRTGGLLMKVVYPDYIMLVNTAKNITWSVQLKNNIIYIQDPKIAKQKEKEQSKEEAIKEKLFDLYKNGKLTTKK